MFRTCSGPYLKAQMLVRIPPLLKQTSVGQFHVLSDLCLDVNEHWVKWCSTSRKHHELLEKCHFCGSFGFQILDLSSQPRPVQGAQKGHLPETKVKGRRKTGPFNSINYLEESFYTHCTLSKESQKGGYSELLFGA